MPLGAATLQDLQFGLNTYDSDTEPSMNNNDNNSSNNNINNNNNYSNIVIIKMIIITIIIIIITIPIRTITMTLSIPSLLATTVLLTPEVGSSSVTSPGGLGIQTVGARSRPLRQ